MKHPYDPENTEERPLHNIEAEQALLGVMMYANSAFVGVDGMLTAADFYEPFHGRLFDLIAKQIRHDRLAEPTILRDFLAIDPTFEAFGGLRYLADLVDRAPPAANAPEYARAVREIALRRQVIRITGEIQQRARLQPEMTGADLMADLERQMLATRTGKDDLALKPWADVSRDVIYGMDRPHDRPLIDLGIRKVNAMLGGAERGDLIVLAGRPGMGKSALGGCFAVNVAKAGHGVAEINGEMTLAQMARRHLTDLAFDRHGVEAPTYRQIRQGALSDAQKRILVEIHHEFAALPLMMLKRTGLTLGRLRAIVQRQRMLWEAKGVRLGLVVVDHVGLIMPDTPGRSRQEDQAIVSGRLKEMADELDVVMLALAQLNRNVEQRDDKRPQLADLRDSGTWEQDADVVIGAYRDAYYARREREPKGDLKMAEWLARCADPTVEAIGLKVREGDVGVARLWADIGRNAIRDEAPTTDDGFFPLV